jgi:hypothetical protein
MVAVQVEISEPVLISLKEPPGVSVPEEYGTLSKHKDEESP